MKKNVLLLLMSTLVLMTACSVDEVYSCDPAVNDWVKANYTQLQSITRSEFVNLPNDVTQRAAFRAVSPQKKVELWLLKIDEILEFSWTTEEKAHLNLLKDLIQTNTNWFHERAQFSSKEIQHIEDELALTMYAWADYAKTEFEWTDNTLFAIVGTLDRINKIEDAIEETRSNITVDPGDEPPKFNYDCDCNLKHTFCEAGVTSCQENDCAIDNGLGCGWLWAESCNGKCKPYNN